MKPSETSQVVQQLRFHAPKAGGTGLIPGPTCSQKNNNNKVKLKKKQNEAQLLSVYLKKSQYVIKHKQL